MLNTSFLKVLYCITIGNGFYQKRNILKLIRPSSYFHQPSDDMKKNQRRNMGNGTKWDGRCRNKTSYVSPPPHSDMGSNNMRQLFLQPIVAEKPMFKMMEEPQPPLKHKVCIYLLIIQD